MNYSPASLSIRFPPFDPERGELVQQTVFDIGLDLSACTSLYTDELPYPDQVPPLSELWQTARNRAVLHVGDSMVQGIKVDREHRFVTLLQEVTADIQQVNLGVSATAPDFHFLMTRKWVARLPVELVPVHLFLGNDIEGLDEPYRCCADGPLLALVGDQLEQRCPTPRWREGFDESLSWFAAVSPPPAIVRQLAQVSQFARYFIGAVIALQKSYFADPDSGIFAKPDTVRSDYLESRQRSDSPPSRHADDQWRLCEAIMRTMPEDLAQRGVPLVVSVLPLSVALDKPTPRATETYQARQPVLDILKRLNIEALDPWDDFELRVKNMGRDAVFLPEGDVHLNAAGHRFYAQWLLQRLGTRIGAGVATSPELPALFDHQ